MKHLTKGFLLSLSFARIGAILALALNRVKFSAIKRLFAHFGHYTRPHRKALALAGLLTLGGTLTTILRPWPLKFVFDTILKGGTGAMLPLVALAILLIAVFDGLFEYGQNYFMTTVGQKTVSAIRRDLFSHIQRLSRSFHDARQSGDLLIRLTGDINLLRDLMIDSVIFVIDRMLLIIVMVSVMFWMDWQLTLIALAIIPALSLLVFKLSGQIRNAAKKQRRRESEIAGILSEKISAIRVVQAYAREAYEDERFSTRNTASLNAGLKTTRLETKLGRLVEIILAIGACGVIWLGVKKALAGVITPGDLIVFISYLSGLYKPIRKLADLTSRISKAIVCGERILSILETEPEIKDSPDAVVAPHFRGEIVFDEVEFGYKPGEPVLRNLSFTAKPGQTVALVGLSGAGKSTIINLLIRFYDPWKGRILIDGQDIRRYTLTSLREQVAMVLQESVLFNTTIQENIAYGKLDASMEEVITSAEAANAHEFIEKLGDGYDTVISERGESLSGGQRQRIAIARAIIRNAPVLILDEPMTGLDAESETKVRTALKRLVTGRTCFLITHHMETVSEADMALVIENGSIIAQGTHWELLGKNQKYRRLYALSTTATV